MRIELIFVLLMCVVLVVLYLNGFRNWLVWAVSEAEAAFGSKTGKLKLRYAYELAVEKFPIFAKLIPFSLFSRMVDEALEIMRDMIMNNKSIAEAISDKLTEDAVEKDTEESEGISDGT